MKPRRLYPTPPPFSTLKAGLSLPKRVPSRSLRKSLWGAAPLRSARSPRGYPLNERISDYTALLRGRSASHLRARCARGSAYQRCSLQFAPSSASQPPCWLDANSRKPVAAMSEPGPRFQSAILAYVILQLSLCRRAKFLRLRRAISMAADISTPRGCASCAHLRGVYLSFSKAHYRQ